MSPPGRTMGLAFQGAAAGGIATCQDCGLSSRAGSARAPGHCPRCGEPLSWRREHAMQRTAALLLAAAILYVPANVLPVLDTQTLAGTQRDTILSGVVFLYHTGSWPLALIVLVASILIPIGKIVALAIVLLAVRRRATRSARAHTRLFRTVEIIGRWSMLDVFVDTFVVALVQLSPLMSVQPGPGVVYFMAVVVLTMLAARSFDPRVVWDAAAAGQSDGR